VTDGFASVPKEVVQRIFIALENLSSSAGFEPANLGSNYKHATPSATDEEVNKYARKAYSNTHVLPFSLFVDIVFKMFS
jgi:hypothetical protein